MIFNESTFSNSSQCAGQSIESANQLFTTLIQTILVAQCSISPPDMWPSDYGENHM